MTWYYKDEIFTSSMIEDNIGFVYAFDFANNKVIWAKNNKIPFRSNLKIDGDNVFLINVNYVLE